MVYLKKLRELTSGLSYNSANSEMPSPFAAMLGRLNLQYRVAVGSADRIPREGPVVVCANHPFGLADGLVLGALVASVRSDVRFLANSMLMAASGLSDAVIPVSPFGNAEHQNANGLREALRWLRDGHALIVFPAGEVAAWSAQSRKVTEPEWNEIVARLVRKTQATVCPVFVHGTNSPVFHAAGLVHPTLRTLLLPHELFNKQGRCIEVTLGSSIPATALAACATDREAIDYLKWRCHVLGERKDLKLAFPPLPFRSLPVSGRKLKPIALGEDPEQCAKELTSCPVLVSHGELVVYLTEASQIPCTIRELGRVREIAFRSVGEGTGAERDLDLFDQHYKHLIAWNTVKNEIAGSYRMACTDEVLPTYGAPGLYTSTLFRYKPGFLEGVTPAIELGRSFVAPAYQKSFAALLLLWKAIGQFVARHPEYKTLFGPVSISSDYSRLSKELMISYLRRRHSNSALANAVTPMHPYRLKRNVTADAAATVAHLSDAIADLEPDRKGLPVLIRQYLNLGGELIDFNLDPAFSDCIDGLLVLDLRNTEPRLLAKYLGTSGAEGFLRFHSVTTKETSSMSNV